MRYANSVGDFGGLTSYDAHFFFYYLFFFFLLLRFVFFLYPFVIYRTIGISALSNLQPFKRLP